MKLSDKAMLASLNISVWTAKKHDKKVSSEVANQHGMKDASMGRYNKTLVAKKALDKISKVAGAARNEFYSLTLPWKDNGSRILTSAGYFQLTEKMRKWNQETERLADEFAAEYPALVEQAKIDLNSLFNEEDYPSPSEIRNKFRFAFRVEPLPVADDFRVQLSDSETALVKQQITASLNQSVKDAMKDVFLRMKEPVQHMADKLKNYKVTADGVEGAFRDSLVDNIKNLMGILPALNLTDDPAVTQFGKEIQQKLCKYSANTLRDNDTTRESVAQAADDILTKMAQFV